MKLIEKAKEVVLSTLNKNWDILERYAFEFHFYDHILNEIQVTTINNATFLDAALICFRRKHQNALILKINLIKQ